MAAELTNGSLYDDVTTTCSTQQTNLVNAISARDTLESALNASMSSFNARLALSNDIREDKNDIDNSPTSIRNNSNSNSSNEKGMKNERLHNAAKAIITSLAMSKTCRY